VYLACLFVCLFVFQRFQSNGLQEASGPLVQAPTSGFCCKKWREVLRSIITYWERGWSKVKPGPNGKCFATEHDQTLFGDQTCWCCSLWSNDNKHVWMDTEMLCNVWSNVRRRSNFIEHDTTRSNKVSKRENVWSCLIAKHFPFGQGKFEMEGLQTKR